MRVLLFGGTSEGRRLAEWLDARARCEVVACCATEYGGALLKGLAHVRPLVGPLDDAAKETLLAENDFACIVDATHPFATHVSRSVRQLAATHGIPLIRLVRADVEAEGVIVADDAREAARRAAALPGNILLTTGTKDLAAFVEEVPDAGTRLYVRVLPVPESLARTRELGITAGHVVAMQGPFSTAFNAALLRELDIAVLVTKASGEAGGFPQKVEAARECDVATVVVGRPVAEEGFSLEQVQRELEVRYGA